MPLFYSPEGRLSPRLRRCHVSHCVHDRRNDKPIQNPSPDDTGRIQAYDGIGSKDGKSQP